MNNTLIIGIYSPFALITAAISIIEISRRFKRREDYLFLLLCLCSVGWFITNITGLMTNDPETAKFCVVFAIVFVGFIPPVLLLFSLKFYKVAYKLPKYSTILLFISPSINAVLALTSKYHKLINTNLEIISMNPLREVVVEWGIWFWIHTAYSYAVSMVMIAIILIRHFKLPRFYRLPSTLMVVGVTFTLLGNVITLSELMPPAIDPTLITMSLSMILFDLAIINNNNSKFVRFSHGKLYNYLDLYILVLDENKRVADYNKPAADWFAAHNIKLNSVLIDDILKELSNKGTKNTDTDFGIDYQINESEFPVVLNYRSHELKDANNDAIGSIAVFTDVTQNRMLIERLEKKAGMDSLTGLANHTAYAGAKNRLDSIEYLPLSVIMCDVNGLKTVNDTLGHDYGDMMLKVIAGILEEVCPSPGFVARTGGDEFIYLLEQTDSEAANLLIEKIKKTLVEIDNLPFKLSVALGAATKYHTYENLDELIAKADKLMYEDKRYEKTIRNKIAN